MVPRLAKKFPAFYGTRSLPLLSILSQLSPPHAIALYLLKIRWSVSCILKIHWAVSSRYVQQYPVSSRYVAQYPVSSRYVEQYPVPSRYV